VCVVCVWCVCVWCVCVCAEGMKCECTANMYGKVLANYEWSEA